MVRVSEGDRKIRERLGREFPGWSVLLVAGRWWAIRLPVLSEQPDERSCLDADSAEALRMLLSEAESGWIPRRPLMVLPAPPGGLSGPYAP